MKIPAQILDKIQSTKLSDNERQSVSHLAKAGALASYPDEETEKSLIGKGYMERKLGGLVLTMVGKYHGDML